MVLIPSLTLPFSFTILILSLPALCIPYAFVRFSVPIKLISRTYDARVFRLARTFVSIFAFFCFGFFGSVTLLSLHARGRNRWNPWRSLCVCVASACAKFEMHLILE
uniref:Uncharacterized protein n=1 Tax=Anopheles darlingi TaxID=43151 RepID=A0A2M4DKD1_ANODA